MVAAAISRLAVLIFGTLYPAYRSYKAVRTKDVKEYVKWMMYWIVFALFTCTEFLADIFVSFWLPFYYELKLVVLFWLLSPYTKGASYIYRKLIHPKLEEHESKIDQYLERVRQDSYQTLMTVGSKGLVYAREVVANVAVKGQLSLADQLKRSYSTSDVNQVGRRGNRTGVSGPMLQEPIIEISDDDMEEDAVDGAGNRIHGRHRKWRGYYGEDGQLIEEEDDAEFSMLDQVGCLKYLYSFANVFKVDNIYWLICWDTGYYILNTFFSRF